MRDTLLTVLAAIFVITMTSCSTTVKTDSGHGVTAGVHDTGHGVAAGVHTR